MIVSFVKPLFFKSILLDSSERLKTSRILWNLKKLMFKQVSSSPSLLQSERHVSPLPLLVQQPSTNSIAPNEQNHYPLVLSNQVLPKFVVARRERKMMAVLVLLQIVVLVE